MIGKYANLCGKRPFLLLFIFLLLPSLACQFGQQAGEGAETENGVNALATAVSKLSATDENTPPVSAAGESRANPLPPGTLIEKGKWTIEVLEINRGDPAWQAVHRANANNQLPPAGWEYLNVNLRIQNNELTADESALYFYITGNGRVKHASYNSRVVSPEPQLDAYLPGRAESEGWETFLIHDNEDNLMFVFEDIENYDDPPLYLAIDEGAAIPVDEDMMQTITPTELGVTQDQPVPFGQAATSEDWQLIVLDALVGDAAWREIVAENQFNDPPETGMEYIMVSLRIRYIGLDEHGQYISDAPFSIRANSGNDYEAPSLVDPQPNLAYTVYPGGEVEGWIVLQAPENTKNLALFFSPDASGANDRYLSLGQGR